MPISIACPSCGAESQVPDASAGARGKCRECGTAVQVPDKAKKICCACGIDVAGQPRTKDERGRYFCKPCWVEHQNAASEPDDDAAVSDELLACPQCGGVFGIDEMDVSGVCIRCATQPAGSHAQHGKNGASKSSFWRSEMGVITAIVAPVVLIGIAVVVWLLWSSHAERQVRDEIAQMKEVGDRRLASGDAEAASKQYADLLAYLGKNKVKDDASGILAEVRRQKDTADAAVAQHISTEHHKQRDAEATAERAATAARQQALADERAAALQVDRKRKAIAVRLQKVVQISEAFVNRRKAIDDETRSIAPENKFAYIDQETAKAVVAFETEFNSNNPPNDRSDVKQMVDAVKAIGAWQRDIAQSAIFLNGFNAAGMRQEADSSAQTMRNHIDEMEKWQTILLASIGSMRNEIIASGASVDVPLVPQTAGRPESTSAVSAGRAQARTVSCRDCKGTGLLPPAERQRLTSAAMAAAAGTGGSAKVDIKCRACGGAGVTAQRD